MPSPKTAKCGCGAAIREVSVRCRKCHCKYAKLLQDNPHLRERFNVNEPGPEADEIEATIAEMLAQPLPRWWARESKREQITARPKNEPQYTLKLDRRRCGHYA